MMWFFAMSDQKTFNCPRNEYLRTEQMKIHEILYKFLLYLFSVVLGNEHLPRGHKEDHY